MTRKLCAIAVLAALITTLLPPTVSARVPSGRVGIEAGAKSDRQTVPTLAGDTNCDGRIDKNDGELLVMVLTGSSDHGRDGSGCLAASRADVNRDGTVDLADLDAFTARLGNQATVPAIAIGPIPGLTTSTHPAPAVTAIPRGVTVEFTALATGQPVQDPGEPVESGGGLQTPFSAGASPGNGPSSELLSVRWEGAEPVGGAVARTAFDVEGPHKVRAWSSLEEGNETLLGEIDFVVVDVAPETIEGALRSISAAAIQLDENATNIETMRSYFAPESIANLDLVVGENQLGNRRTATATPRYATSIFRTLDVELTSTPPGFAALTELRLEGTALGMGTTELFFSEPGAHVLECGPPTSRGGFRVDAYRTMIERPQWILDGEPATFEARTEPPGYEHLTRWLSSTKHGSAEPTLGNGATFTTTFEDTFGDSGEQWIGVRAGEASSGQDLFCPEPTASSATSGNLVGASSDGSVLYYDLEASQAQAIRGTPAFDAIEASLVSRAGGFKITDTAYAVDLPSLESRHYVFLISSEVEGRDSMAGFVQMYPIDGSEAERFDGFVMWLDSPGVITWEAPHLGLIRELAVGAEPGLFEPAGDCFAQCGGAFLPCYNCCLDCVDQAGGMVPQNVIDNCTSCINGNGSCLSCLLGLAALPLVGAAVSGCVIGCGICQFF